MDHKMICKQFLITGITWGIIGGLMSVLFRLQLGYPDAHFQILEDIFGKHGPRAARSSLSSTMHW